MIFSLMFINIIYNKFQFSIFIFIFLYFFSLCTKKDIINLYILFIWLSSCQKNDLLFLFISNFNYLVYSDTAKLQSEFDISIIKILSYCIILILTTSTKMSDNKGKPYMIQMYDQQNNLLNKYKFVILAKTVAELRQKIVQKLEAKKALDQGDQIKMKDTSDFELGSDDEVDDVVPDCKIRIYLEKQQVISNVPQASQKKDKQEPQIPSVPVLSSQPSNSSSSNIPPSVQPSSQTVINNIKSMVAVDVPVIDTTNWTQPQISQNCPKNKIWNIICPQIRKTQFQIEALQDVNFYELSKYIIKQFNFNESLKALVYTSEGQPLLFNLDLMYTTVPKLDLSKTYYVIFTATSTPSIDSIPAQPTQINTSPVNIKVSQGQNKMQFNIDLANSLSTLKYRIFKKLGIPPMNQILKFANNALVNDVETLQGYNLKADSILTLEFKTISNLIPSTYADKFFYKDVQMIHQQETQAYRNFKCHLLALGFHLSQTDKNRLLSFVRMYTANQPLVGALRALFTASFMSQAHRIALEQGFYSALWTYAKSSNPHPHTQKQFLFNHTRHFLGFCLESLTHTTHSDVQFSRKQETIILTKTCQLTTKDIKIPGLIKLDDGKAVLVDKSQLCEQIDKGYTFPLIKEPKKENIFQNQSLFENFQIFTNNSAHSPSAISICLWLGSDQKDLQFTLPKVESIQKYEPVLVTKYANLKVHQPLEIKNKSTIYLILLNKEGEHRIFVSKNKDINRPHNIYDVITGKQENVNLDLLMAAGKTQNLEEAVDIKDLKPVITRQPKEALVVLFDVSGSMGGKFFNEADLKRIGACKLFFEALAYRTIAYSFEHVVSLTFFDNQINVQLDFTEAIYDFNRLVSAANPRGSTRLYDAIVNGVNQLLNFKKKYPECILRILALTDGQDTCSTNSVFDATKAVVTNDIIMDSFAVGTSCEGLKTITFATGGKCYLTRNIDESLKLFQQETVLSVRARKVEPMVSGKSDEQIRQCIVKAQLKPFDMGNNVHEFKMPQIKGAGLSTTDIIKKYASEEGQKKLSANASLKRITKQIEKYNQNPHPFVAIYPCENINVWKILLLGPKETPYENGLFLLYANFPGDYPFRAPEVRFITPIYHCNMNQQGRICHSVFDRNYSPAITFRHIVDCIYGLILTPEPEDPLDNVIASYFLSQYPKYVANAKEATHKNASKSTEQLVEQIFGKISDDSEKQKKIEEINKWIEKAKSFN